METDYHLIGARNDMRKLKDIGGVRFDSGHSTSGIIPLRNAQLSEALRMIIFVSKRIVGA